MKKILALIVVCFCFMTTSTAHAQGKVITEKWPDGNFFKGLYFSDDVQSYANNLPGFIQDVQDDALLAGTWTLLDKRAVIIMDRTTLSPNDYWIVTYFDAEIHEAQALFDEIDAEMYSKWGDYTDSLYIDEAQTNISEQDIQNILNGDLQNHILRRVWNPNNSQAILEVGLHNEFNKIKFALYFGYGSINMT